MALALVKPIVVGLTLVGPTLVGPVLPGPTLVAPTLLAPTLVEPNPGGTGPARTDPGGINHPHPRPLLWLNPGKASCLPGLTLPWFPCSWVFRVALGGVTQTWVTHSWRDPTGLLEKSPQG